MNAIANLRPAGEIIWFGNTLIKILIPSATGQDGVAVIEHHLPYGDSPPLHVHRNEDEIFHILEGTVRLRVNGADITAGPGDTLIAPKGIPHTYRVESGQGARFLTVTRGSDFETMLRTAGRPASGPELPEAAAPTPDMIATLVAVCAENGIDIVGPPLA